MERRRRGVGPVPPQTTLSEDEHVAVRALRPAVNALMRALDADLVRLDGLSHTEYLCLMYLAEAHDNTLRMTDLAAACQQSLSGVSRVVNKLEAAGLVRRQQGAHDARTFFVVLGQAGRDRFLAARPRHLESLRRYFFDNLEDVDVRALGRALERITEVAGTRESRIR